MSFRLLLSAFVLALANPIFAATYDPSIQNSFLEGSRFLQAGDYQRAESVFRSLLAKTDSPRIKLELARALFHQGKYKESKNLFREVLLDPGLPWQVRDNIQAFISNIENADGYFKYSISIVSDSNPRSLSKQSEFSIGGLRLTYLPPSDNKRVTGISYLAQGSWPLVVEQNLSGYFVGSLIDYPNSSLDRMTVDAGLIKGFGSANPFSVKAGVESSAFGGKNLYELPYVAFMPVFFKSDSSGLMGEVKIGRLNFPDYSYLNSLFKSASLSTYNTFSQRIAGSLSVAVEDSVSNENAYSYRGAAWSPSISMFFPQPALLIKAGVSSGLRKYEGIDPFFGLLRQDSRKRIDLSVQLKKWRLMNSNPKLIFSIEKNRSNIDFYNYKKSNISIAFE